MWSSWWEDLRYGFRTLRLSRGFATVAILTLGIGIAANTTVFAWIDSILVSPIPGARDTAALYLLETVTPTGEVLGNFSYLDYRDYRDQVPALDGLAVARFTNLSYGKAGSAERVWGELVSPNYFETLGVQPALGNLFRASQFSETPEAAPYVVVSHAFWTTRLRGDPAVIGKSVTVNLRELTVVGVAAPGFSGTTPGLALDLWIPLTMAPAMGTGGGTLRFRGTRDLTTTFARIKPGSTLADASGQVDALARHLAEAEAATNRGIGVRVVPFREGTRGAQVLLRGPLSILMAVCILLFLIVCSNVANLLLVRFTARQKELGVRLSMGAPWRRLLQQMLAETFLLALAGGALGVLLSRWMSPSLALLLPPNEFPIRFGTPLEGVSLFFTAGLCIAATLLCGLVPAAASLRQNLFGALRSSGKGETSNLHTGMLRRGIVIAQVTLATVALIGTGLFLVSFRNVTRVEPGFRTKDMLVGQFFLSPLGYTGEQQRKLCVQLRQQLREQSAIADATYTDSLPLQLGPSPWHQIRVEGYTPAPGEDLNIHRSMVAPGYFALLEIPVLEGREFNDRDIAGAPEVLLVNQTFANRYFGGENPVGRRVQIEGRWATIVGLVKDTKLHALTEGPTPYFYRAFLQGFAPGLNFSFLVRANGDSATALSQFRRQSLRADPNAQPYQTVPLSDAIASATYSHKVAAWLLSGIGAAALLLATLGIFGVISYTVARRTREVAIRMALGATRLQVVRAIVPEGLVLVVAGLGCGVPLAAVAAMRVRTMLVGVQPLDPPTLVVSAAILFGVGLLATLVPAIWASRVQPAIALRAES
jgi:predicted permease